ncbi:MAG: tetratricopeptide repeat protein, partial [Bacteroidales bacterium]|nr:tetratricopeptide repeat protein [Bacteroidales bacterium]
MNKKLLFITVGLALITICSYGQSGKKFFNAGNEFHKKMRYEDAISQFTNAIDAEPSNPEYYYARGKALMSLLKYEEAKADFEKALVFSPKYVEAFISLG